MLVAEKVKIGPWHPIQKNCAVSAQWKLVTFRVVGWPEKEVVAI